MIKRLKQGLHALILYLFIVSLGYLLTSLFIGFFMPSVFSVLVITVATIIAFIIGATDTEKVLL